MHGDASSDRDFPATAPLRRARGGADRTRRAVLLGLGAAVLAAPARAQAQGLRFGLTPVFLDNEWQVLEAMRRHLSAATGEAVSFVQRRTYKEVVALLLLGEIDAAWLCGWPLLQHRDRLAALALPVWRGELRYRAHVIVHQDREAAGLGDLRGDVHAWSDPDSNSGHLVTVTELIGMGEAPERFFARSFFTFGHRNVVRAVARKLAQSGSVDGYVWEALAAADPELTVRTRVIWRSEWLGFPPICVQAEALGTPRARRLFDALASMSQSADGAAALTLLQLDGFVAPPPDAFDGIARRMRVLAERG